MRTLDIPGAWYCDTAGDDWIAAVKDQVGVQTSRCLRTAPEPLLWVALAPDGVRFAGSGHRSDHAWEWDGTAFQDRGKNAGLHAVMYDVGGNLIVISRTGNDVPTGALGNRYVDDAGHLVPAIDTYDPRQRLGVQFGVTDLWEFTEHGGILVGQGQTGVVAIVDGHRKRIDRLFDLPAEPYCAHVNFHTRGDNLSISFYSYPSTVAHFVWLTVAELRALPDAVSSVPPQPVPPHPEPPVPEPPPVPDPEPPEEPPVSTQEQWERWMDVELPHLMDIYAERHGGVVPQGHWGAFQTARRGITVPEGPWTYDAMVAWEQAQGSDPTNPPEPP